MYTGEQEYVPYEADSERANITKYRFIFSGAIVFAFVFVFGTNRDIVLVEAGKQLEMFNNIEKGRHKEWILFPV